MFLTNFLSEFVYCILSCYAHMNILQMEYAHYKCKLLLLNKISHNEHTSTLSTDACTLNVPIFECESALMFYHITHVNIFY